MKLGGRKKDIVNNLERQNQEEVYIGSLYFFSLEKKDLFVDLQKNLI